MESKAYDVPLAVSLLEARKALSEHRKWMEGLESSAFTAFEKTEEAITPSRRQDTRSLEGESFFQKRDTRNAHWRSGLILVPPDGHAPKHWKTIFRSSSSKVGQQPSEGKLRTEPNVATDDHQRHRKQKDSNRETVRPTGRRPVVAWQSDPDKIRRTIRGQESDRNTDNSQEPPIYRQIIVRAKETPDIEDQSKSSLPGQQVGLQRRGVSHTGNHHYSSGRTMNKQVPDGATTQEKETDACMSANELISQQSVGDSVFSEKSSALMSESQQGVESSLPAIVDSPKLSSEYMLNHVESNSRGVVHVLPAERQTKPFIGTQTLQTSSRGEVLSLDPSLLSKHPSVNVSVIDSMGGMDGTLAMGDLTSVDDVKTVDVKPLHGSCLGVSIPCEEQRTDNVDDTETKYHEGIDDADSTATDERLRNNSLGSLMTDKSLQAVTNDSLDLTGTQKVDSTELHTIRELSVETASSQTQDDEMLVNNVTNPPALNSEHGSDEVHHNVDDLMSEPHLSPTSVSSQPPVTSDELLSTELAHFTLPFSFDLSSLDEFVLPKIERRSRPPPPYELHRHSKMASHGLPCPPYGMVARSQNIESSQVRSSTAVGGSETKRLSSRSLSPVKSTTTAHGSVTDDESVTSLHRAARAGNVRQVSLLLERGSNINAQDKDGRTPLMYCLSAKGTHLDCADCLVGSGCDMDIQASDGSTALHEAVYVGAVALVQLLLGYGANPTLKDSDGRLPVHWSVYVKSPKCLLCLLSVLGCDVNVTDDAGMTPLMWAAYHDTLINISELLSHGADADEKDVDGKTAMHWAIHQSNARSLKLLLKHDRTFYKDMKGRTVLHIAADMGSMSCCQLILKIRPDSVNDSDKNGRTPLHWAAVRSRVDVCALLLSRGADASERDHHGKTALDYAREKSLTYVEALLTCHDAAIADYVRSGSHVNLESVLIRSWSSSTGVGELGHGSTKSLNSPRNAVAPLREQFSDAWKYDQTAEVAKILEKGCWLSKWTFDSEDQVCDYFFWLDVEMGHVCWAKRPADRHRQDAHYHAHLMEVHGEPSDALRNHPGFDADGKHRYSFWLIAGDNRLDLVAHSEIHYKAWVQGAEKFLLFGPVGINPSLAFVTSSQKHGIEGWTGHSLVGRLVGSRDASTSTVKT